MPEVRICSVFVACLAMTSSPSFGQEICQSQMAALQGIQAKYSPQQKTIENESKSIEGDSEKAKISGTIDVDMKEHRWIFDVPEVTMRDRNMALDLPQVTIKNRSMSWDMPVTVMKRVKTGQYPEVTCSKHLIPKCTVTWSNMYADIPTTEMRRQELVMGVPEFRMDRTNINMKVPEFKMSRVEWLVKVPEFTVRDVKAEGEKLQARGQELEARAKEMAAGMMAESATASSELYGCYRADLVNKREQVSSQFDLAAGQMTATIDALRAQGANPEAVTTDTGPVNLVAQRNDLLKKKAEALAQLDKAAADMDAKQQEVVQTITV